MMKDLSGTSKILLAAALSLGSIGLVSAITSIIVGGRHSAVLENTVSLGFNNINERMDLYKATQDVIVTKLDGLDLYKEDIKGNKKKIEEFERDFRRFLMENYDGNKPPEH